MGLGGLGPEGDRALEVGEGLREVPLLAEHEAQEAVRVGVALVEAQGLGERVAGGGELAALGGGRGAARRRRRPGSSRRPRRTADAPGGRRRPAAGAPTPSA